MTLTILFPRARPIWPERSVTRWDRPCQAHPDQFKRMGPLHLTVCQTCGTNYIAVLCIH